MEGRRRRGETVIPEPSMRRTTNGSSRRLDDEEIVFNAAASPPGMAPANPDFRSGVEYEHTGTFIDKSSLKSNSNLTKSNSAEPFRLFEDTKYGVSWTSLKQASQLDRRAMRSNRKTGAMPLPSREGFSGDTRHMSAPGVAGFLEIEEEPPRQAMDTTGTPLSSQIVGNEEDDLLGLSYEPVATSSGLLLTHRKTPPVSRQPHHRPLLTPNVDEDKEPGRSFLRVPGVSVNETFEMDASHGNRASQEWRSLSSNYANRRQSPGLVKAARILSFVRLWVVLFCAVLIIGTVVAMHSIKTERAVSNESVQSIENSNVQSVVSDTDTFVEEDQPVKQVILLPHDNIAELTSSETQSKRIKESTSSHHGARRLLQDLREEFEDWVKEHNKVYHSDDEKEKRFSIWSDNHHRTIEKNKKHGPCMLTKKPVFGSNHFKDLTPEEFQSRFLTGYNGPTTDKLEKPQLRAEQVEEKMELHRKNQEEKQRKRRTSKGSGHVLASKDPLTAVDRHPDIQRRFLSMWDPSKLEQKDTYFDPTFKASSGQCQWYNISCWLRWFFNTYGYGIGGVLRPSYDSDSYPSAVDWREMGVVSDVHSQGNCGACWAITAVETIESAYALKKGTLLDLCETEVIVCDDTCDMCEGGWPQNAYEYVMENNGLPAEDYSSYDGDFLLALTYTKSGQSQELDSDTVQSFMYQMCPSGGGSHSGDGNYEYGGNDAARYGSIRGYGYATERCICYTDGTGCDCDDQNEAVAVRNIATYGPATVCLEASLWQDYAGGIMTAEIGCSSAFLDMNHCVQVVGYAFIDVDENEDGEDQWEEGGSGSGSNSHSGSGGSQDSGNREGYWIVRNQWSSGWGMNGYAYVAMGYNTCGVLNDMTQAYC